MPHLCHAEGCGRNVPPKLLFCSRHWTALPKGLQFLIWRYYRAGQEVDKQPSTYYLAAQQAAVAYTAASEQRIPAFNAALQACSNWAALSGDPAFSFILQRELQTALGGLQNGNRA